MANTTSPASRIPRTVGLAIVVPMMSPTALASSTVSTVSRPVWRCHAAPIATSVPVIVSPTYPACPVTWRAITYATIPNGPRMAVIHSAVLFSDRRTSSSVVARDASRAGSAAARGRSVIIGSGIGRLGAGLDPRSLRERMRRTDRF